jgi:hypothetical protein
MQVDFTKDGKTELIKVSSKASPLLMILTTVAALLVLQATTVLLTQSLAWILTFLIGFNLLCGIWLLVACGEQLMPTTLQLDADGLTCNRLLTSKTFSWDDISALKLVPAGSVSDAPRADNRGRVGVGVVLRAPNKSTGRDAKLPPPPQPTIVVVAGLSEYAEKMIEIIEHGNKFHAALTAKPQERWKRAQQPQQQQQFRKRPNVTMPA